MIKEIIKYMKDKNKEEMITELKEQLNKIPHISTTIEQAQERLEQDEISTYAIFDAQGTTLSLEGYSKEDNCLILDYIEGDTFHDLFYLNINLLSKLELLSLLLALEK